jgi:hypothetical protein
MSFIASALVILAVGIVGIASGDMLDREHPSKLFLSNEGWDGVDFSAV